MNVEEKENLIKESDQAIENVSNANKPEDSDKKKNAKAKYAINISLVLIITALAIYLSVYKDASTIWKYLLKCDYRWLLIIFALLLGMILMRSLIFFAFARMFTRKYHFHQALAVDMIGVFYNAVTPGGTGGQPMQAYTYKKQGIPIASAVSIMAMFSILYQIVLSVYGILSFIIKFDFIKNIGSVAFNIGSFSFQIPIIPLTIVGFFLNVSLVLLVLLMGYWRGFHNFIMGPCIGLLTKMHIVKKPNKMRESLRVAVESFKVEFRRLLSNKPFTILIVAFLAVYMTILFSVPFFVGKALGNESTLGQGVGGFWNSVFLSNYHQMVTGVIPIPGSAGVSEIFFQQLFVGDNISSSTSFYYISLGTDETKALGTAALLIWRSITFILPLVAAGFVTAFYRASPKEVAVNDEGKFVNTSTLVQLQSMTYKQRLAEVETLLETSRLTREAIMNKLRSLSGGNKKKKSPPKTNHKNDEYHITISDDDDSKM